MQEFNIALSIALFALIFISFLLLVLYVTIGISRDLKLENEEYIYKIELLEKELRLQKNISEWHKKELINKN